MTQPPIKANQLDTLDLSQDLIMQNAFANSKNAIINGNFSVWQRGISSPMPNASHSYGPDRFFAFSSGTGQTGTMSQQPFDIGQTDVPGKPKSFMRVAVTTAGTAVAQSLNHRIEDVRTFAGQTVTLSFWAKTSSPNAGLANRIWLISLLQNLGSGGSGIVTNSASPAVLIPPTWTKFSFTLTLDDLATQTLGTESHLELVMRLPEGVEFELDLAQIQLEANPTDTDFEYRTLAEELSLCHRYYLGPYGHGCSGFADSTFANIGITFPQIMRITPTIGILSTPLADVVNEVSWATQPTSNAIQDFRVDREGASIRLSNYTTLTTGNGLNLVKNVLTFDAELF